MKRITTILTAAAVALSAAAAQGPSLKIYRDEQPTDTVYGAKYYLIGVTEPGATATIGGEDCHVYRTGSFGREIMLDKGENIVPVVVKKGRGTTRKDVRLVYVERERTAAAGPAVETFAEPMTVVTREGAYLQHGNGGDRLGGSKMNYLPAGVPLTVSGSCGRLYRVSLAPGYFAYVPADAVEKVDKAAPEYVNSGSVSITNTGMTDRIVVSLPERRAYYAYTTIDPSTIVVTIYGVTNNSNWMTQRNTPGMVDYVDLRSDAQGALTMIIRLKEQYSWGYAIDYEGTNLVIDVRHRPESLDLANLTIGLDAGHGGEYLGAVSPSGLTEKEVNLDIVLKMAEMLRAKGATVVLTRDSDTGPSMTERKRIWLDGNVDLAISVHNNASGNPLTTMGTSTYYKHIANRALAADIHDSMLEMGLADFGLTGNFNFSLNSPTEFPNTLVEVLFMSSLPEEELLADPDYRTQLAAQIVKGLESWLQRVKDSVK